MARPDVKPRAGVGLTAAQTLNASSNGHVKVSLFCSVCEVIRYQSSAKIYIDLGF